MSDPPALKVTEPKIPAQLHELSPTLFVTNVTLRAFHLALHDLTNLVAKNMDLSRSVFEDVELSNSKLTKILANDAEFKHCGLANADCSEGSFIRAEFLDCRMTGWDANMTSFEDVVIKDSKLDMANCRSAKFLRVRFENCILTEADFIGAQMEDVAFEDCVLERVNFSQCQMKNADLRSSDLTDISGWASLKGAIIDTIQLTAAAPYLAAELGLKVED